MKFLRRIVLGVSALLMAATLFGCSGTKNKAAGAKPDQAEPSGTSEKKDEKTSISTAERIEIPGVVFSEKAPDGAVELAKAKENAKEGDEVVIRGRIGGVPDPFVKGRAVLTLCDMSVVACNDQSGDNCPKPWDMCCDPNRFARSAAIQIVGEDGKLLSMDLEGKNGLLPLSVLVVKGKVGPRPDKSSFVVNASEIFVEKPGMKVEAK